MCTASSAKRTTADSASAVEYTATDLTPSSRHARATRRAISPRLAIRTFSNTRSPMAHALPASCAAFERLEVDQRLLKLHPLTILHGDLNHASAVLGGDLVHDLHRLHNTHRLSGLHHIPFFDKRPSTRLWRAEEGSDQWRDDRQTRVRDHR